MSRWKVAQHIHYRTWLAYPASYDADQPHNDMDDDRPRTPRARAFRTWREAVDYADRMARTGDYVLPRISRVEEMRLTVWQDQFGVPRVAMSRGRIEYGNLSPGHIAGVGRYLLALAYLVARRRDQTSDMAVSE